VLPGILGALFGAMRLGVVFATVSVVFGEIIASRRGLGQRLVAANNQFNIGGTFAIMTVLSIMAPLLNTLIRVAERRSLRWQGPCATGPVATGAV
jgi:ABC-type nitrate/sulfonate/bicarbonate transport system permease component